MIHGSDGPATMLVRALDRAWDAMRERHTDLPQVMMIVASGTLGRSDSHGLALGHFAPDRWATENESSPIDALHEVFVSGEGLPLGAVETMGTVLHEGAHVLARVRNIRDTSREGRYHNLRFARLAEEVGLEVAQHPTIGWSLTTVPDATAEVYRDAIATLDTAITVYRRAEHEPEAGQRRQPRRITALCSCRRRIVVAPSIFRQGPITCGACNCTFQEQTRTREATGD